MVKEPILVPMVDTSLDQDEGFADSAVSGWKANGVWCCCPPWVPLSVDDCQSRVADAETAVLVDDAYVGRLGYVEGVFADGGRVAEVDQTGDER